MQTAMNMALTRTMDDLTMPRAGQHPNRSQDKNTKSQRQATTNPRQRFAPTVSQCSHAPPRRKCGHAAVPCAMRAAMEHVGGA